MLFLQKLLYILSKYNIYIYICIPVALVMTTAHSAQTKGQLALSVVNLTTTELLVQVGLATVWTAIMTIVCKFVFPMTTPVALVMMDLLAQNAKMVVIENL